MRDEKLPLLLELILERARQRARRRVRPRRLGGGGDLLAVLDVDLEFVLGCVAVLVGAEVSPNDLPSFCPYL